MASNIIPTNQIAKIQTNKKLIAFYDKLHIAPIEHYAQMTDKDHMEFLDTLLNSKAKIMLSGYRHPLYDEKLKEWKRIELKNQSTSGSATTEIIWMNYRIGSYVQRTLF